MMLPVQLMHLTLTVIAPVRAVHLVTFLLPDLPHQPPVCHLHIIEHNIMNT